MLIWVVSIILPIHSSKILARPVEVSIKRRSVFDVFDRSILESEARDETWRRRRLRAIDMSVLSTAEQETASEKYSSSPKDAKWNTDTETDLLPPRKAVIARWWRDGVDGGTGSCR